jgi:Ca2+-transporting ATPase
MENRSVFSQTQLNKLLNPKSLQNFQELGGLVGIERGLRTNIQSGLSSDKTDLDGIATSNTISDRAADAALPSAVPTNQRYDTIIGRRRIFGENRLPVKKTKSIWALAWVAYNDKVLILLTVAAVISLSLGIYQSIAAKGGEARVQWVEGVAIVVAILIVVIVGAANDWQKERQFAKLNRKKEDRRVKVIRSAKTVEISVFDLVVGDVMHLEAGVLVPVDGIFIGGYNVKCDESSTTGESTLSRKVPGDDVYRAMIENHPDLSKLDPFIVSGSKVSEGLGAFLVTATGVNSIYGRTLLSLQDEIQTTPLQSKLNLIAEYIAKLGLGSALILFVVLFIKFLANLGDMDGADAKGQAFLQIFIVTVTIIVVAVPEGLPLAVTLALAFATTRMMKENNLVRFLRACETMGNATTVCSDKTGTLTQNKMSIVAGSVGTAVGFGNKLPRNKQEDRSNAFDNSSPSRFVSGLSTLVKEILLQSIVLNSTAFEGVQDGLPTILGSKTESALLSFAQHFLGLGSVHEYRCNAEVVQMFPFDPSRKCMAVVIRCASGEYRLFAKGAPDVLLSRATGILRDPSQGLTVMALEEQARSTLQGVLSDYASSSLRTIALLYRDFDQWPPRDSREGLNESTVFTDALSDLNFIGLLGIQDPLRPGVTESVQRCQRAGVFVRMVTGDNLMTAKAIAMECGIYTPGGIAMDGSRFRELSNCQMNQIIPRLQVLARSTPEDKKILVSQLQKLGETVAVTGDGTNDAPALRTADVGFAMGIMGTDVAKEASDIILMDDNFSSIVTAIAWGRTVNDAVKKFLQVSAVECN